MTSDIAIAVQNISKCYRRYRHPTDRLKELILPGVSKGQQFWALDGITFDVKRGESLGILGQNGSGKSTLLQIITQTLSPTGGTVTVHGRISALLELGSGFNPDFTGRQNVLINGRILGFSQRQVQEKLETIQAFAEIGDFIDQPVHTYSSGMFVRLAFAAAVVWDPEILIVDEALAVGDIFFQQKCFAHIRSLQEAGATILFVSHDTQSVLNLCDRAVVLDHGKLVYLGDTAAAVEKYFELHYMGHSLAPAAAGQPAPGAVASDRRPQTPSAAALEALPWTTAFPGKNRFGIAQGLIEGVCVTDGEGQSKATFLGHEELVITIRLAAHSAAIAPLNVGIHLKDRLGQVLVGTNLKAIATSLTPHSPGQPFICQFRFKPQVAPGEYSLDVAAAEYSLEAKTIYDWINGAALITIANSTVAQRQGGLLRPDMTFTIHELAAPNPVPSP